MLVLLLLVELSTQEQVLLVAHPGRQVPRLQEVVVPAVILLLVAKVEQADQTLLVPQVLLQLPVVAVAVAGM
jgi:hypothetical protein